MLFELFNHAILTIRLVVLYCDQSFFKTKTREINRIDAVVGDSLLPIPPNLLKPPPHPPPDGWTSNKVVPAVKQRKMSTAKHAKNPTKKKSTVGQSSLRQLRNSTPYILNPSRKDPVTSELWKEVAELRKTVNQFKFESIASEARKSLRSKESKEKFEVEASSEDSSEEDEEVEELEEVVAIEEDGHNELSVSKILRVLEEERHHRVMLETIASTKKPFPRKSKIDYTNAPKDKKRKKPATSMKKRKKSKCS